MPFNPKVSIIIPVYNGSDYLRDAIDSALFQTYKNIEVIVVNDGSNDEGRTETIAKSYGDRIRYFYKENGGVSSSLNFGIRKAEGEYIGWLSHDDCYMPNKIEIQIDHLKKERDKELILFSDYEMIDEKSNTIGLHRVSLDDPNELFYDLLTTWPIHGCTTLIPKSCFYNSGFFDEDNMTVQDYEMWFRLFKKGYQFKYITDVLTRFRIHSGQGTFLMKDSHHRERENTYINAINLFREQIKLLSSIKIAKIAFGLKKNKALVQASNHLLSLSENQLFSRLMYSFFSVKEEIKNNFKSLNIHLVKLLSKLYEISPNFIKKGTRYCKNQLRRKF